jgi:tetratricopeptide (TPR) repeat protein
MKKKYVILILFLMAVLLAFVMFKLTKPHHKTETTFSEILPRRSSLAYTIEWTTVKNNATILLNRIRQNPHDIKSLLLLTALYIQEGRNTGNFNYYNNAALECINTILKQDPVNFEALTFKSTILLSQHRFAQGLKIANQAQQLYPLNAYVYGLMIDGNVELGNYQAALDAADKMVSIRPDIRSYSRIAYLREIYGDIPGAMEAMQLAVEAGAPGDENTEWCRVQLGKLNEQTGRLPMAKMQYTIAVNNRPGYPYALGGLARIAVAEKRYDEALALYQRANSVIPDHIFKEGMAEVYTLQGEQEKARQMSQEILNYLQQGILSKGNDTTSGQNEDHEMAHAYMGIGALDKALQMAITEYNRRPANIEVNETVAIVYYRLGDYAKALPYIETALKTHCSNPELLCRAGLIYAKAGQTEKAKLYLTNGLKNNPILPVELNKESNKVLDSLL